MQQRLRAVERERLAGTLLNAERALERLERLVGSALCLEQLRELLVCVDEVARRRLALEPLDAELVELTCSRRLAELGEDASEQHVRPSSLERLCSAEPAGDLHRERSGLLGLAERGERPHFLDPIERELDRRRSRSHERPPLAKQVGSLPRPVEVEVDAGEHLVGLSDGVTVLGRSQRLERISRVALCERAPSLLDQKT